MSRGDLGGLLSLQSASRDRDRQDAPFERRETRQEREARKQERERLARVKERERSLREEHIDGGFLVTLGTYTGIEDFSKPVVRQLQVRWPWAPAVLVLTPLRLGRKKAGPFLARPKRLVLELGRAPARRRGQGPPYIRCRRAPGPPAGPPPSPAGVDIGAKLEQLDRPHGPPNNVCRLGP